jgi:hypothetical protein
MRLLVFAMLSASASAMWVELCIDAQWKGDCEWFEFPIRGSKSECQRAPSKFVNKVSSLNVSGGVCTFYSGDNCQEQEAVGASDGPIGTLYVQDIIQSYDCKPLGTTQ